MKETWISVLFFVLIVSSILTIAIGIATLVDNAKQKIDLIAKSQ
jgi:hypothetical protein